MLLLKPREPLFSQALSYCRINNELKEKWTTTRDFASTERCYVWKGDAEKTTNAKKESPNLSVPGQLHSVISMRTFSRETQPMSVCCSTLIPSLVLSSGGKDRFHGRQESLETIYHQHRKVYFEKCPTRVHAKRCKVLHGCRQTARPTFLEGKAATPCTLRHPVSPSGRNIHNQSDAQTSSFL